MPSGVLGGFRLEVTVKPTTNAIAAANSRKKKSRHKIFRRLA